MNFILCHTRHLFYLFHFTGSQYPHEPPLVTLLPNNQEFPKNITLKITKRLMLEAENLALKKTPCCYALIDLANNPVEILKAISKYHCLLSIFLLLLFLDIVKKKISFSFCVPSLFSIYKKALLKYAEDITYQLAT